MFVPQYAKANMSNQIPNAKPNIPNQSFEITLQYGHQMYV
jgi:hypothetical protein